MDDSAMITVLLSVMWVNTTIFCWNFSGLYASDFYYVKCCSSCACVHHICC